VADGFEDGINRGWRWHSWFDVGQGLRLRAFAERRGLPAVTDLRDADAVRLKPRRVSQDGTTGSESQHRGLRCDLENH